MAKSIEADLGEEEIKRKILVGKNKEVLIQTKSGRAYRGKIYQVGSDTFGILREGLPRRNKQTVAFSEVKRVHYLSQLKVGNGPTNFDIEKSHLPPSITRQYNDWER